MAIQKTPTGIAGFDGIVFGGLPKGWTVLLSGSSGTGKTIFALQYLYNGVTKFNENSVFVACEENSGKIKKAVEGFGWDLGKLEDEGKLIFIEASGRWITDIGETSTEFGLGTLMNEIEAAVKKIGAKRVVIDPASTLLLQFERSIAVRRALNKIATHLESLGCTTLITVERPEAVGMTQWKNVEDFVLDGVVILSAGLDDNGRRNREIEVMKMRGEYFISGKHPLKISGEGFLVFPMLKPEPLKIISKERMSTGVAGIDEMMRGGVLSSDCTLVAGSTGAGKTLLSLEFIREGVRKGDKCLYVSLEESLPVLRRNASCIGFDIEAAESQGKVRLIHEPVIDLIPEEFLLKLKHLIEEDGVRRLVLDSVTACSPAFRNSTHYRDSLVALIGLLKSKGITSYVISEMPELFGTFKVTDSGTSFIVDNIILLRYVEVASSMSKAISVLKMRGSPHEKGIQNYKVTDRGIVVMDKFRGFESVLSGMPKSLAERIEGFFE